jgi:hypothetical protein
MTAPGALAISAAPGAFGPFMDRCDVGVAAARADLDGELARVALHGPNHTEQTRAVGCIA